ncbi:MAG: DUF3015 family protein [Oceanococcus sp.]
MKIALSTAIVLGLLSLSGCTTTDAVSLPFDLASTTGDSATSSSSSSESDGSDTQAQMGQERYVSTQISYIRSDASRGEGESLAALAQLLGEADSAEFGLWAQQNYDALFANLQQPEELLQRIQTLRN